MAFAEVTITINMTILDSQLINLDKLQSEIDGCMQRNNLDGEIKVSRTRFK